jgi:hypothetical protein
MHTVELLQEALDAARRVGYDVRQDWLGGDGGGHCIVRGRRLLLLDVAQSPAEQLDIVADALSSDKNAANITMSRRLAEHVASRSAA